MPTPCFSHKGTKFSLRSRSSQGGLSLLALAKATLASHHASGKPAIVALLLLSLCLCRAAAAIVVVAGAAASPPAASPPQQQCSAAAGAVAAASEDRMASPSASAAAAAASAASGRAAAMPRMLYGTAWKKQQTTQLVEKAVLAGFRGIDTACQPKHYQENLVGRALAQLQQKHNIPRHSLFIQTKFTPIDGQDRSQPLPYDPNASLPDQVRQSFATSLANLGTDYLDSLVLHSPLPSHEQSMQVWRAFEELVAAGKVLQLGISNIYSLEALQRLYADAAVKPAVVQNRFYAKTGYDRGIRQFCACNNVTYQSFWTLTANPDAISSGVVRRIAKQRGVQPEQVWYRFVMQLGILPLNGTTNQAHMAADLAVLEMPELSQQEMRDIGALIGEAV